MFEHTIDQYQEQFDLEQESTALGIKRYRDNLLKSGTENSLPGIRLVSEAIPAMALAIEQEVMTMKENIKGVELRPITKFIDEFDGDYDAVSFITAQSILMSLDRGDALTATATYIGKRLEAELEYRQLLKDAPGLYKTLERQLKATNHEEHRRKVIVHVKNKFDIVRPKWGNSERVKLGIRLVYLFEAATGLIEIVLQRSHGKTKYFLNATSKCNNWLTDAHSRAELIAPVHLPMVVPPRPWSTPFDGGYLFQEKTGQYKLRMMKTENKSYLEELKSTVMPEVYGSVNTLQETPWRINKGIYQVLKEVWETGGSLGKLPARDDEPLPAKPVDIDTNEVSRTKWKRAAGKVRQQNIRQRSKRIAVGSKLWMAEKFMDKEAIYYVWTIDWRGRAYPLASYVHPQADDSGKALLQFAAGKPLGENGAYWLAVHIAGLFGVDKCSFEERVQWVRENESKILDSATRPLDGDRFWTTADKPWCALAACYEWLGFSLVGSSYVSHLPVSMDGSCNGLQNFSAVLRDHVGGRAVNLIPSDTPQDIYTEVLRVVEARLPDGSPWAGKLYRQLVKRPVMTLPYGATRYGMQKQIMEELDKYREEHGQGLIGDEEDEPKECAALAGLVYESIGEVVIAARKAMDWLQEVARIAARKGLPVHWHTPMGLPVLQHYFSTMDKRIKVVMGTKQVRIRAKMPTYNVDKKRMAQGIAPNVVHSWDAAHLMRTVLMCREYGIESFSMVHDSYGTHACDVDVMSQCLRRTFIDQYSAPILEDFLKEILEQVPEEMHGDIPPLPECGNLELEQIMLSEFFFA